MRWFLNDLIPADALTFVVGNPGSGKSTFGAFLCSHAYRAAILPGNEESVETALVPRLAAANAPLERIVVLDGRLWSMPHDRKALTEVLRDQAANLLWIDPIDSYIGECSENDGQPVRHALECFAQVARDVGCAVVAARHPGKQLDNLCPGSRQWRAVPRVILSLVRDEGPPLRRFLRIVKDPYSRGTQPREFTLEGPPGEPKIFTLGQQLDEGEAEVMSVADGIDRWKIDQATHLLEHLLAREEQESSWIFAIASKEHLDDRIMRRAAKRLGVEVRREGVGKEHKSYWSLPTPATPDIDTETPHLTGV